jgi:hypothetical protein
MITDYNKLSLLKRLEEELGWKIDYVTLWTWEKKKYIGPSAYFANGKRLVPIYYERDFKYLVNVLHLLHELGKIRIKGYEKKTEDIKS